MTDTALLDDQIEEATGLLDVYKQHTQHAVNANKLDEAAAARIIERLTAIKATLMSLRHVGRVVRAHHEDSEIPAALDVETCDGQVHRYVLREEPEDQAP